MQLTVESHTFLSVFLNEMSIFRMGKPFLSYGDAVEYGMENVSWLSRHSLWGRYSN